MSGHGTVSLQVDLRGAVSGIPPAILTYAAWARLLSTYSGENDVVFGIAGDRPLRVQVAPWQRVGDFLDTVTTFAADVAIRLATSPERLCALADFEPGSPLFDTAVYLDTHGFNATEGHHPSVFVTVAGTLDAELTLHYAHACLSDVAASELLEQLGLLMQALPKHTDAMLHAVPTLAGRYATRALHEWNDTREPYDDRVTLHGLVERRASTHPQRLAVVADDDELNYGELDRRANQLARHLLTLGVGSGSQVGLCTEKSAATVVGMLGIMKTGAAYVPIDPDYPSSRIGYMASDAHLCALLTWGKGNTATANLQLPRVALDSDWTVIARQSGEPLPFAVASDAFAYAIYTSGSTGQPKCALLNHRGRINNIEDYCRRLQLGENDRVLCVSSLSFDISVCNIFCMFRAGGCVVFPSLDRTRDPDHWLDLMQHWAVTFWHSAPALMEALLEAVVGRDYDRHGLRVALLGGDWIPLSQPDRARTAFPQLNFVTAGGATELSIDTTFYPVDTVDPDWHSIPYGRPLANQSALILGVNLELLPPGVPGELHLGGVGMGAGYLNQPALTAERFIPHPWPSVPGERLYRTGDLARYMPDGTIELLGRMDFQVKIRGVRIELGELEFVLAEHPSIAACLASAPHDAVGDRRLVAYVVPTIGTDEGSLPSSLHAWLAERLPSHLVPEAFVMLERLPLTPNGKVDRRNLPVPSNDAYAGRAYEPPRGDTEQTLAKLWQDLLGLSRIGRHDSFLDLGGHSLLTVRLRIQIRRSFSIDLSLGELIAAPSLAAMAERIADSRALPADSVPTPRSTNLPAPLSSAQKRMWFIAQMNPLSAAYHMPAAWHLRGILDEEALVAALNGVLDRHESLRSRFVDEGGEPKLVIDPVGVSMPLTYHDLHGHADIAEALKAILAEEAHAPFNLASDTLVRSRLIRLGEQESVLALTQHHIVSDGWSYAPLLQDIGELYAAWKARRVPVLATLPLQYPDYAAWQNTWLDGEHKQRLADYWNRTLANAPQALTLPTDRPRSAQPSQRGEMLAVSINTDLTSRLRHIARRHGSTLFGVVLTAWSIVLSRLSGQHDLVVGSVTAHRAHAETEALVGFFVNTLALRIDLSGDPSLGELLARVRRTVVEAQDHEDLPFERVVELSRIERLPGRTPLFQVMLAWQSHDEGELCLDGLEVTRRVVPLDAYRFELELSLREEGGAISGELGYASSIFDASTIERHRGYLLRALEAIASDVTLSVGEIELLGADERDYVLNVLNQTDAPYPDQLCIHQLFEQQVRQHPEATALVFEDQSLSYAELNTQANRLAHHLINLGVRPDDRVAICVERSLAMVVGLLAILKAGGAYVPLDPAYPSERLTQVLHDAAPVLLLADTAGRTALGETAIAHLTVLDLGTPATWAHQSVVDPDPQTLGLTSTHLAYVIYTSGSTGSPKGVMVEHHSLVNHINWQAKQFSFNALDVFLQRTSSAFDASGWEIWTPIAIGARLVLPPVAAQKDIHAIFAIAIRQEVTIIQMVPSLLAMPSNLEKMDIGALRYLFCGGEPLSHELLTRYQHVAKQGLINLYGPTEATIDVTAWSCPPDFDAPAVPIGRPIANTRIYLLDAHGQP
ncbi:non-ribosomal peptide synthetase, partial [Rhodanobacter sp. DHG33]|uniref:non-ribosomal peptide synthetase n=1 Tax=Rhodanobacter sp. DHG33 TaxID=2775921 RepID=UPI001780C3EB|nr:amino acid adenylation domain-containing protein [Rhodanobacter sp. DHG33]